MWKENNLSHQKEFRMPGENCELESQLRLEASLCDLRRINGSP